MKEPESTVGKSKRIRNESSQSKLHIKINQHPSSQHRNQIKALDILCCNVKLHLHRKRTVCK